MPLPPAKENQCPKTRSSLTLCESFRFEFTGKCCSVVDGSQSSLSLSAGNVDVGCVESAVAYTERLEQIAPHQQEVGPEKRLKLGMPTRVAFDAVGHALAHAIAQRGHEIEWVPQE